MIVDQVRYSFSDTTSVVLTFGLERMAVFEPVASLDASRVKHLERVDVVVLWMGEATACRDHEEAIVV